MKLSFSTKGWKNYSWQEFCDIAQELSFSGIELHDINAQEFGGKSGPANIEMSASTVRNLKDRGLTIPCLDSLCDIAVAERTDENIEEIKDCLDSAVKLKIPYVRIHARNGASDKAVRLCLDKIIPLSQESGVGILIETSGIYADTKKLGELLNSYAYDNLGVLWDFNHTYRNGEERPADTIKNLGAYVKHIHLKDSEYTDNGFDYRLVGEGTLPIADFMNALRSINYDGFISIEWDPAWLPELDDITVIFAHFVSFMGRFVSPSKMKNSLYDNKTHTGKYVWRKEMLVDQTFPQVLDRMVEEFPDQYAFKYTTLDYTRTYAQFRDDVDNFARALVSLGVRKGSHVAIWATNLPQWYITFWATTKIGAVLVTVNTAYKIDDAEYLLKQSDTHTLVMIEGHKDANYKNIMNELCPEIALKRPSEELHSPRLPFLRHVISVGFRMKGCLDWDEAMQRSSLVGIEEIRTMAASVNKHDVCNMQYTSGTTGFPKGVMLTHYNVVNNGKCIGDRMDLSTADRMMVQVPMFHCFGMVLAMTATMTHGGTLCPVPYFSPKSSLACINQERITCFHGVPTMFIALFSHEDFAKTDFSYMRTGIMAGSGCPPELMRRAATEMNMTGIVSVYGETESSPGCTMSSVEDSLEVRSETVGSAFPNVECKIIDPETGEDLPDNENGEFVARGYNVMKGYYKMPNETAQTIDKDGWLHTGDIACRRPDGNYKITGRLKDMIIRGGENIYPKEIEEFIYTHPLVSDVQVIGVPDKAYGEEIMACIILKSGAQCSETEMKDFIASHIAKYKVPRYIEFTNEFPMNDAGKIQKYKMRENAAEKLRKLGIID